MKNLRTNFIRCQINSHCYAYQIQIQTNQHIQQQFYEEIQAYFLTVSQNIVFDFPFVYSIQVLELKDFHFMLSNGQKIKVLIRLKSKNLQSKKIHSKIHRQMTKMTKFLYCSQLQMCFNPFQQKQIDQNTTFMPGFYLKTENQQKLFGFYIVPIELIIDAKQTFSQSLNLLNHSTGRFYTKQTIVRFNKQKNQVLFRNGDIVKKQLLKSVKIKDLIGFEMASVMYNYNSRIKSVCKKFIEQWQIKYDIRFMEVPYNFFSVGHLIFRGEKDKSLGQLLSPVSLNNYNYNYRNFFNDVCFYDDLDCELYFLIVNQIEDYMMTIISWFQNTKQKMGLNFKLLVNTLNSFGNLQQINTLIQKQPHKRERIYIVPKWKCNDEKTQQNQKLIQNFIDKGFYFHQIHINFQENQDLLVLKNIAIIYTKLRLNPWKIKQIPFGNAPFVAFSINIKFIKSHYAISVIGTMNAYLTKFTCLFDTCSQQSQISKKLLRLCKQCLQKFKSVHKCSPNRIIILRTGQALSQTYLQYQQLKNSLQSQFNSKVTVVIIENSCPIRLFNQIDMNFVSKETIKKPQLMSILSWKQQKFISLELQNPVYKIKILEIETLDPNFQNKIFQFVTKMVFGGVGNQFGTGLGFVSYGQKLNLFYKTYKIDKMLNHLKQGLLLFL